MILGAKRQLNKKGPLSLAWQTDAPNLHGKAIFQRRARRKYTRRKPIRARLAPPLGRPYINPPSPPGPSSAFRDIYVYT